jgi:hypothetical protein
MAKLPIVKEDVVPLWFVLDAEDNIIFGTAINSVRGIHLLQYFIKPRFTNDIERDRIFNIIT